MFSALPPIGDIARRRRYHKALPGAVESTRMRIEKEIAMAQDSMLNGKMGACGMHLSKAMHAGMAK
jgi:hypothetical protein